MSASGQTTETFPPANVEAEKTVLGSMILDPRAIDTTAALLEPQHFYQARHQHLYAAILELHEKGIAIDFMTLVEEMKRKKQLDEIGGPAYITSLEQYVFSTANVNHHAAIVREKYQLRELIRVTQEIQDDARNERQAVGELLDHAEKLIFDLSEQRTSRDFRDLGSLTVEVVDEIDQRCASSHDVTGVGTGYTDLDEWTGGFQKSDLIILAARPSVGKTAFALNLAANIGAGLRNRQLHTDLGRCVGIFSLEMSCSQVNQRLLSTITEVPMHLMRAGKLGNRDKEKLHRYAKLLYDVPIYIDDTPGLSILEMRAKCRRLASLRKDLSLIIIDYLQLMRGSGRAESRQQEVSEITRSLKALARELNLPIIALSQLSRMIEQRKGKHARPMLSDLRESGAIEQDADVVMFLHREKTMDHKGDGEDEDEKPTLSAEPAELIIGKQRNGPIGTIDLVFFRETATYHNLAKQFDEGPGF